MDYIPTSRHSIDRDDHRIFLEKHEVDELKYECFWTAIAFVTAWLLMLDGLLWEWFVPLFYWAVWRNTQEHPHIWVKQSDAEMRTEADRKYEQHPEVYNKPAWVMAYGPIPTVYDHKPINHTHPFFWRPDRWIINIVIVLLVLLLLSHVGRSL